MDWYAGCKATISWGTPYPPSIVASYTIDLINSALPSDPYLLTLVSTPGSTTSTSFMFPIILPSISTYRFRITANLKNSNTVSTIIGTSKTFFLNPKKPDTPTLLSGIVQGSTLVAGQNVTIHYQWAKRKFQT